MGPCPYDVCRRQGGTATLIDVRGGGELPGTLSRNMRDLWKWLEMRAPDTGLAPPVLLSSCRSAEEQRRLQQAWDRGDRAGLAARPVDRSAHIPDEFGICRAIDLGNSRTWLAQMGPRVVKTFGDVIEWGGTYLPPDLPHFEERAR